MAAITCRRIPSHPFCPADIAPLQVRLNTRAICGAWATITASIRLGALADIEHPHMRRVLLAMRAAGVDDIEQAFVERESQPVRPDHVGDDGLNLPRARIDPVDIAGTDLALRLVA